MPPDAEYATLPARAAVHRAARWDGIVPIFFHGQDFRPVTPAELADVVSDLARRREASTPFDVVVWADAPGPGLRADYEQAGATWLIEGPPPGPGWLDDAMEMASGGPPAAG